MINKIIYLLALILLGEIAFHIFFDNWEFNIPVLNVLNRIACLLCGLLLITLVVLKRSTRAAMIAGTSFMFVLTLVAITELNPIDTITEPKDVAILSREGRHHKVVVREYKNMKTSDVIRDTLFVKDVFLFRKKIKQI